MTPPISPAEAIFLALADLNPDERDAFLREHCGHDAQLRAEVEAMLQAIDATDDEFLDPARLPSLAMAADDGPLQPGTVISNCFVLHAIGSGGVGVVYAAQQEHPRRTVAIKVLRRGFRRPEILRRFEREAELLGRLQHPGVAQVFAFSRGNRRVPAHLVMEFVTGPPITEYVEAQALGYAARIELMIAVGEAVQHAHDRGIIHRDLKPANVLVSDDGGPKTQSHTAQRVTAAPAVRPLMAESHDHRTVAVGLVSGTVLVLDSSSGTQLTVVQGDGTRLDRLAFDTEGRLAMGWASGRVDRIRIPGR